ncbi:MAG TPA: hypothetical protein VHZ51_22880 [Ktedonobacteraceae bacterium]|nr:hypothetical protein [Ktedonobacteraceae bacterium]
MMNQARPEPISRATRLAPIRHRGTPSLTMAFPAVTTTRARAGEQSTSGSSALHLHGSPSEVIGRLSR